MSSVCAIPPVDSYSEPAPEHHTMAEMVVLCKANVQLHSASLRASLLLPGSHSTAPPQEAGGRRRCWRAECGCAAHTGCDGAAGERDEGRGWRLLSIIQPVQLGVISLLIGIRSESVAKLSAVRTPPDSWKESSNPFGRPCAFLYPVPEISRFPSRPSSLKRVEPLLTLPRNVYSVCHKDILLDSPNRGVSTSGSLTQIRHAQRASSAYGK